MLDLSVGQVPGKLPSQLEILSTGQTYYETCWTGLTAIALYWLELLLPNEPSHNSVELHNDGPGLGIVNLIVMRKLHIPYMSG